VASHDIRLVERPLPGADATRLLVVYDENDNPLKKIALRNVVGGIQWPSEHGDGAAVIVAMPHANPWPIYAVAEVKGAVIDRLLDAAIDLTATWRVDTWRGAGPTGGSQQEAAYAHILAIRALAAKEHDGLSISPVVPMRDSVRQTMVALADMMEQNRVRGLGCPSLEDEIKAVATMPSDEAAKRLPGMAFVGAFMVAASRALMSCGEAVDIKKLLAPEIGLSYGMPRDPAKTSQPIGDEQGGEYTPWR